MRNKETLFREELKKARGKELKEFYDRLLAAEVSEADIDESKFKPWIKKVLKVHLEKAAIRISDEQANSRAEEIAMMMVAESEKHDEPTYDVYRYQGGDTELKGKNGSMIAEIKTGNYVLVVSPRAIRINQMYFSVDDLAGLLRSCDYVDNMKREDYNIHVQQAIREGENGGEVKFQDACDRVDQRIANAFNFRRV